MSGPGSLEHLPVMRDTAIELLGCRSGGLYVDGTIGGGGYAEAILEASAPDGILFGLDWDAEAVSRVRQRLRGFGERLVLERASFADLPLLLKKMNFETVDGIVLDLGVSSFQLDDASRGFSFNQDGPLDMRMDRSRGETAADLVNSLPEKELADMIYLFGEERLSRRIARHIVSRRTLQPFTRTAELADVVRGAVPRTKDSVRIHPATRTFQALRLAVNREQDALERFLADVLGVLRPGGRLCIVSFHSLEDRMVKVKFREWARSCRCPASLLRCECEGKPLVRLLSRKALRPAPEEVERNPRSRSARLRALEKC